MIKERVRLLRREIGMTQQDLANALCVHQTAVSQWESGRTEPDIESVHKLARIFGVSADYLLGIGESRVDPQGKEVDSIWELRETMRRSPELQMLFSLSKDASKEDILKTVKILKTLKGEDT